MTENMNLWFEPNKILREIDNNTVKNYDPIFHYTDCSGMMGIINNDKKLSFWFTRSDCLNDTSEGQYIQTIYLEACNDLLENGLINTDFFNLIKELKPSSKGFISFPYEDENDKEIGTFCDCADYNDYICCFSMKSDSLDMWRYYSKSTDGYALKLNPLLFLKYEGFEYTEDVNQPFSNTHSFFVVYNRVEQIKKTKEYIILVYKAFNQGGMQNSRNALVIEKIKAFFDTFRYVFKHECFSSEQEFRFVFRVPKVKPKHMKNPLPEIKIRNQSGIIIPYIVVDVDNADDYLEEIIISPFVKEENAINRTLDFIHSRGFSTNNVKKSNLPVR